MSFRGTPYVDIEFKVDWEEKEVSVICDGCGKDNFPVWGWDVSFTTLMKDYEAHVRSSHNRKPPTARCSHVISYTPTGSSILTRNSRCVYKAEHEGGHRYEFTVED